MVLLARRLRIWSISALAATTSVSCFASPSKAASEAISEAEVQCHNAIVAHMGSQSLESYYSNRMTPVIHYLHLLQTNWDATINQLPREMPLSVRAIHETMQFYFAGRTNLDEPTIDTLLQPPAPLRLDKVHFSELDWQNMEASGLKLRLAWFQLFSKLQPTNVLLHDSIAGSLSTAASYLNDFARDTNLVKKITTSEFNDMMTTVKKMPSFANDYINQLVDAHQKQVLRVGPFENLHAFYKNMGNQFNVAVNNMYWSVWLNNPRILENRMSALNLWIGDELGCMEKVLKAAKTQSGDENEVLPYFNNFLSIAMQYVSAAGVGNAQAISAVPTGTLSDEDMAMVRELNQYVRYEGQQFDVEYTSKWSRAMALLKAGDQKAYRLTVMPDDSSANLTLPIEEFANYAQRLQVDEFKADLAQIRARLEGLQDLAKSLTQQ
jgi:hypothetical protein